MLKLTHAWLLAASVVVVPVMAQTSAPPSRNRLPAALNGPAAHDTSATPTPRAYDARSARTPALTDIGGLRASKIVGSSVYNDHDEKVGSIDDLVIGNDKSLNVVVSVGGFLGLGSKRVVVPFDKLRFGNTKGSSDSRVVMPGVTKGILNGMPDYTYINRG